MAREEKPWNPAFTEYMGEIVKHPNYEGLPIKTKKDGSLSWVAGKKTETGKARIAWSKEKAKKLEIPNEPGMYAKVMLAIHPFKQKPCQICGTWMSIFYHYPSANFIKAIKKRFPKIECNTNTHISVIWGDLEELHYSTEEIKSFFIQKGKLTLTTKSTKDEIIDALEDACRNGGKKLLSPGAMSNFPDRFDGFHSYNRCCRSKEDKGRSKENLKSYTQDRRAYEYWSGGNIHAANQFMGSQYFKGGSADHIGPISLGFVHDPRYLQKMPNNDNSSKRDRLQCNDIEKIIEVEKRTGVYPMSWYSKEIWEYIRKNYKSHKTLISGAYKNTLKQNMINFMYVLDMIIRHAKQGGKDFLEEALLQPNYKHFDYSYEFNEQGEITKQENRHFTERNKDELERYKRIAFESVKTYNTKENRNMNEDLTTSEKEALTELFTDISNKRDFAKCKKQFENLLLAIQNRLISELENA